MNRIGKLGFLTVMILAISIALISGGTFNTVQAAGNIYYIDCSAPSNGGGSFKTPWKDLDTVNAFTFSPGDSILFNRGTTCHGQLWPKGSGVSGKPIKIGAYGSGPRPVIDGDYQVDPVLQLYNQEYWEVADLEVTESSGKGIYIGGSGYADLTYFRLTNLYSHHHGLHNGENAFAIGMYKKVSVHDVIIDNVVAHDAFRGIEVGGDCCNNPDIRSSDIIIRNSTVYDVENDGILVASSNNVLVEHNLAYNTGLQPEQENHTPNAIWNWDTDNALYQFNEAYQAHSPEWDGGAFDIDYFTDNSLYQYNYAHDNDAYCISVFGGNPAHITTNNVVRYNICSNNARDGSYDESRQGDIYLTNWYQGSIADTYIYNNTVYWNPAGPYYAIKVFNIFHGRDIINTNIYNNIIYSESPKLVYVDEFTDETALDYNLYWYTGTGDPEFYWDGTTYTLSLIHI